MTTTIILHTGYIERTSTGCAIFGTTKDFESARAAILDLGQSLLLPIVQEYSQYELVYKDIARAIWDHVHEDLDVCGFYYDSLESQGWTIGAYPVGSVVYIPVQGQEVFGHILDLPGFTPPWIGWDSNNCIEEFELVLKNRGIK